MGFILSGTPKKETSKDYIGDLPIEVLHKMQCQVCPLNKEPVHTPHMEPSGAENPSVYILGEAPSDADDMAGTQFVGSAGDKLREHLPTRFISREIRFNNVVRTRPNGRNPTQQEIECCRPSVEEDILRTRPKAIWGMGYLTVAWALGKAYPGLLRNRANMAAWRGRRFPLRIGDHTCWFYPMYHPSYILNTRKVMPSGRILDSRFEPIFREDLRNAMRDVKEGLPEPKIIDSNKENLLKNTHEFQGGARELEAVEEHLNKLSKRPVLAFDLETNCLRPYADNSKILSIAIGHHGHTISIAVDHPQAKWTPKQKQELRRILSGFFNTYKGKLIAHNLSFDLEWICEKYGKHLAWLGPRWQDTMAQAYLIDSRPNGLGLDFLCIQYFGLMLKSQSNVDRSNLETTELEEVLPYNALDTKYTHVLYKTQRETLKEEKLIKLYNIHVDRIKNLVRSQQEGALVDQEEVLRLEEDLTKKLKTNTRRIGKQPEVHEYESRWGQFNPDSPEQVLRVFKELVRAPQVKTVDKHGKFRYSVDESVLSQIDNKLAQLILKRRGIARNKSTYVEPLIYPHGKNIWSDGRIHTNWKSLFVVTGRLSSEQPNMQNYPKRDNPWVRRVVKALPRCALLAIDYGQLEARVITMLSQDKTLVAATWEGYDVHMEWAQRIAHAYPKRIGGKKFLKDKAVMKKFRSDVKNQWTFPAFYGASLYSISGYLNIPQDEISHLFDDFWEQFEGVLKWQQGLLDFYEENMYIECATGRRRYAPLSKNEIINTPVQGSAADIVLDSMTDLSRQAAEEGDVYLQAILNIHDDLTFNIPKKKFDDYQEKIMKVMVKPRYPWIIVPLMVEPARGENWCDLTELEKYTSVDAGWMEAG